MLAQLGCGPELGERIPLHAQPTPDHHHRPTPTPGTRGSRRCGDFPGRGMWGRGPPGTGGQDSPWREAQRGRSAGGDSRPVSTAPRAGRLSTWGWGGRGEAGGAWAGVRASAHPTSSPPSSSCPPPSPPATLTPRAQRTHPSLAMRSSLAPGLHPPPERTIL